MAARDKPLLIYDGDCNFCSWWIVRWGHVTGDRVEYAPYQEVAGRFPRIAPDQFDSSVQFIDRDGEIYSGAEAVFRALAQSPGGGRALRMYREVPGFAPAAEWVYRFVARRRGTLSRLTRFFWGERFERPAYFLTRRLFFLLLAACYFFAFGSLLPQISGLVGEGGILPARELLQSARGIAGAERFGLFPTLLWLDDGDASLKLLCAGGMVLALLVPLGIALPFVLFILWAGYLSLLTACDVFLGYQWDTLLLETGFLAIFLAPFAVRPNALREREPSVFVLFLSRWLLFRLMFGSGAAKLLSGDPSWRDLTALNYYYETQPLPTAIGWYAHQLPEWFQKTSVVGVFAIQTILPFLVFAPRRYRLAACAAFVFFQAAVELTGNYGFFNLLSLALCVAALDDAFLRRFLPRRFSGGREEVSAPRKPEPPVKRFCVAGYAALVFFASGAQMAGTILGWGAVPGFVRSAVRWVQPFYLVNRYGLFAVMTRERREIAIEGSANGQNWLAYEFKWKPGDTKRAPPFVAPYQPRLDWQMWFAALSGYQDNPWLVRFMARLLEGSPQALSLLDYNPFPDAPPRFVRAVIYDYHFTDGSLRKADGSWWRRELLGLYVPTMQLRK